MSNEALDTINRFFFRYETTMHFFGNKSVAQKMADYLSFGKIYTVDAPDIAILYNDNCLAIEHFEFDCYENSNSGSKCRREQAHLEQVFKEVPATAGGRLVHGEIRGNTSYQQYISNVSSMFNKHYVKIEAYKKNLFEKGFISHSTPLKIAFLIEDTSPLGTSAYDDNGERTILLSMSIEFLKLMRNSPDVDYVIACSRAKSRNFVWLISKESLDEYDKNAVDYERMKFVDFTPKVINL
jgi:hypothetical protein